MMETSQSTLSTRDRSHVLLPESLHHARITSLPQTAYYIPNFISEEEEQMILDKISSAPKPRWKQLTKRRLQTWPSDLVNNKLLEAPLPAWLQDPVISRLLSLPTKDSEPGHVFSESPHHKPNHVLINEYPPGIGIMPHKLSTSSDISFTPSCSSYIGWCRVLARSVHSEPRCQLMPEPASQQARRRP